MGEKTAAALSNLNGYAKRLARTIKESCLDRLILFGEGSPRKAIREFVAITIWNEIMKGWATGSLLQASFVYFSPLAPKSSKAVGFGQESGRVFVPYALHRDGWLAG